MTFLKHIENEVQEKISFLAKKFKSFNFYYF